VIKPFLGVSKREPILHILYESRHPERIDGLSRGCIDDPNLCPSGTQCQLDALGQGYCDRIEGSPVDMTSPAIDQGMSDAMPLSTMDMTMPAGGGMGTGGMQGMTDMSGLGANAGMGGATVPVGGEGGAVQCPEVNLVLKPAAGSEARVMLAVDRSYSMIMTQDRWSPLRDGIETVMSNLTDSVQFGLTLFPNPNPAPEDIDPTFGEKCASGVVNVDVGFGTQEAIIARLDADGPVRNMGTPTASALAAAGRFLLDHQPTSNDYILLATDGGPGCNAYASTPTYYNECICLSNTCFDNLNCLDDNRTEVIVRGLAQQGIKTMVLGITIGLPAEGSSCSSNYSCSSAQGCVDNQCQDALRPTLSRLALAGGAAVDDTYFEVTNLNDLQATIQTIAGSVRSCTFDLESFGVVGNDLVLYIDDMRIDNDPNRQNGWYAEDNLLTLYGNACTSIRDGRAHTISAQCAE
jgi:hypothetical protein